MPNEWKRIDDNKVINVWKKSEDDDCGTKLGDVEVTPDWYEQNGTPICHCGADLVYSHTLIQE